MTKINMIDTRELYKECLEAASHYERNTIRLSHLPFEPGYYITEYGVILMVKGWSIYSLENDGWVPGNSYMDLWYDSMTDFARIPVAIREQLKLEEYEIQPLPQIIPRKDRA